ncbi:MAG: vanadium-dependent haloperoxidase [Leptolyngbyaceae cyanobacterium MAG.088]|nr:vanadium-dependent haloperoxidase [Leptolyngbyaceae cyanobacterium MAG.088]
MSDRRQESYAVRLEAAELARSRQHPTHEANGDEQRYADSKYFMSFTKGLPHNEETGLLQDPQDFVEFRRAIDDGFIDPFTDRVRHGAKFQVQGGQVVPVACPPDNFRQWEAPTAGVVYELQGPDPQAVTMPPAPPLLNETGNVNPELVLEMAEVYELAILRDQPFNAFENGRSNTEIEGAIARLNNLSYVENQTGRPRKVNVESGQFDAQTLFRGSSPGVEVGPYLSQFLMIGNTDVNGGGHVADGKVTYGVLEIDQRVPIAKPCVDYMTDMESYVAAQRGLRPDGEGYVPADNSGKSRAARRFISTPRDLATYVHYDALYEAYLNACIILLGMGTPFDPAFDHLSGVGVAAGSGQTRRNAGGFALYGGPHILNLVTEVATRALKAVRFQKFNSHIRLRPEALAARIELVRRFDSLSETAKQNVSPKLLHAMGKFSEALKANGTLHEIYNLTQKSGPKEGTYLLPMAFPEGSPMHPAYGAGHATVAGACVTILKAFFDTNAVLAKSGDTVAFKTLAHGDQAVLFRAPEVVDTYTSDASCEAAKLIECESDKFLTLEGELNKLAANISIGRDMAGVHYFSDYFDSLRMGEEIAIGILEEQALTYSTDPFVLSVPTFDGDVVRIGNR